MSKVAKRSKHRRNPWEDRVQAEAAAVITFAIITSTAAAIHYGRKEGAASAIGMGMATLLGSGVVLGGLVMAGELVGESVRRGQFA